jgi:MYXO-CTERM domain-containing protein
MWLVLAAVAPFVCSASARAVIVIGPQGRNTSAPTGSLANAGWQWVGQYGAFTATAIAPNYVITAAHTGLAPGGTYFAAGGTQHTVVNRWVDTGSDLMIFSLATPVSSWAPLWDPATDGAESGRNMFVTGRGTQRGDAVFGPSSTTTGGRKASELKGWLWGASDGVQTWGTNVVTGIANTATLGQFVLFDFNRSAGDNEGTVSSGDSGGGVFVQNASGQWKLAAVNYGVEANWFRTLTDSGFQAALFDAGGLYADAGGGNRTYVNETATDDPATAYSSRVAGRSAWIASVLNGTLAPGITAVPEPSLLGLAALATPALLRRRRP